MSKLVDKLLGKYETGKKQKTPGRKTISPPARLTAQKRASAEVREPAHTRPSKPEPPSRIVASVHPDLLTFKDKSKIPYLICGKIAYEIGDYACEKLIPNNRWSRKVFDQLVKRHPKIITKMINTDDINDVEFTAKEKETLREIVKELGWSTENLTEILDSIKETGEGLVSDTAPEEWPEIVFDVLADSNTDITAYFELKSSSMIVDDVAKILMNSGWLIGYEFDNSVYDSYRDLRTCQMEKMALLFPEEFWEEAKAVGIEPPPSVRIDEPVSPYSDVYAEVLELILEQAGAE